jgi:hypothetical protein
MEMHSPTTRGEVDNGTHKPITHGKSGGSWPAPDMATVQSASSDELMWLLLERMLDFSVQCRQSQSAFAQGNYNPVLQELLSLLRMNGGGAFGNNSFGAGYNNSFLVDKISYLITKLDQQEHNLMNQNGPLLPSTGPILEILFQMLQNQKSAQTRNNLEYTETVQKHLKVLGEKLAKLENLTPETSTLDLLLALADKELQENTSVMNTVIQDKNAKLQYTKHAFNFTIQHNSAQGSSKGGTVKINYDGSFAPVVLNSDNNDSGEVKMDKWEQELNDNIYYKVNKHLRTGITRMMDVDQTSPNRMKVLKSSLAEIKKAQTYIESLFVSDNRIEKLEKQCRYYETKINEQIAKINQKNNKKKNIFGF